MSEIGYVLRDPGPVKGVTLTLTKEQFHDLMALIDHVQSEGCAFLNSSRSINGPGGTPSTYDRYGLMEKLQAFAKAEGL